MEGNIKQQSISYNKGITNVPSEILSEDGELSSCEGLTFENGELKAIQDGVTLDIGLPEGATLLYVHTMSSHKVYIYYKWTARGDCNYFRYKDSDNNWQYGAITGTQSIGYNPGGISSVGKTLIMQGSYGCTYYLWNDISYDYLGSKIPEPEVELSLAGQYSESDEFSLEGMIYQEEHVMHYDIVFGQKEAYNDAIIGGYSKVLKTLHQKKGFAFPIVARTAVELYDGTYILHSSPIVLLPMFKATTVARINTSPSRFSIQLFGQKIYYKMSANFSGWDDIVRNVVLFVSKEIPIFDTTKEAVIERMTDSTAADGWQITGVDPKLTFIREATTNSGGDKYNVLQAVPDSEVANNIAETSVFFKLCELGKNGTNSAWRCTDTLIKTNTIENIETQQQLSSDDYFSHCSLYADYAYSYNNRLHLANVRRTLFNGFTNFMPYNTELTNSYDIATYIRTSGGNKIVVKSISTQQAMGNYYFYPDPRAYKAEIYINNNALYKTMNLVEHPSLNGAYYFEGLPTVPATPANQYFPQPTGISATVPEGDNYSVEILNNMVLVSEVDNPFTFLPKGYNAVGNGTIVGIAAVTMALSEYQHGRNPLVVFSSDGIWSLTVNSEGYYDSVQSVSREICNNASSITQVDMGIYFASAKGLMYLDTSGVKCVSAQMKGTAFDDFIDDCQMAYDYRDSLLHIFRNENTDYNYVYNMKSGTFSTRANEWYFQTIVVDYPDTLIQKTTGGILSLLNKPDEKDDTTVYSGSLTTRAMKFGNVLTLKSIRQLKHLYRVKAWELGAWNGHSSTQFGLTLTVEASNDGYQWVTLSSLRGKPWKFYKFTLNLSGMSAADRLAGTVAVTQERRVEKLR